MADVLIWGWDAVNATWVPVAVNADGELIVVS